MADGLGLLPQLKEREAQVVVGLGAVGPGPERPLEAGDGLAGLAGPRQGQAEVVVGVVVAGPGGVCSDFAAGAGSGFAAENWAAKN